MYDQQPSIKLQFPNLVAAGNAFDLLQELGYEPEMLGDGRIPELSIHIEKHDVQSALEITHAYGGHLKEEQTDAGDAYGSFGEWNIPAHLVAEDFPDPYVSGASNDYLGNEFDAMTFPYSE